MALRAKKPEQIQKRLKLMLFSEAKVGKTWASVQFPNAYIIDTEKGCQNYSGAIARAGSVVFESSDYDEIMEECRQLLTTRHNFRTLVLDSGTMLYTAVCERSEKKMGGTSSYGSWADADRSMKRLFNVIKALDMNVIVTWHEKIEYQKSGNQLVQVGKTYDGWKRAIYEFDLALQLMRPKNDGQRRIARVIGVRKEPDAKFFNDGEEVEWSYEELKTRYETFAGQGIIDREATPSPLATVAQIDEMTKLLNVVRLPEDWEQRAFSRAGVDSWEEMTGATVQKCIDYARGLVPGAQPPAPKNGNKKPEPTTPADSAVAQVQAAGLPIQKGIAETPKAEEPAAEQMETGDGPAEPPAASLSNPPPAPKPERVIDTTTAQPDADPHAAIYGSKVEWGDFDDYCTERVADSPHKVADVVIRIAKHCRIPAYKDYGPRDAWSPDRTHRVREKVLKALLEGRLNADGRIAAQNGGGL